ncbi:MAG TPA: protein kinase [Actinomycetes bacterium]|nr:protein kinase [Actinomycetes bacterium]
MSSDPATGTQVAGYRIVKRVGSGGMGVVYRAEETGLGDRPVALKLLPPALADDPDFRARFLREMRVAAAIDHPNIVPIYRAGEDRGQLYLAMRYVHASDLRRVLETEGRLDPVRTLAILDQVARALDAAHARGLVHRDVKPGNILLAPPVLDGDPEHVYLVDFGLARADSDDRSIGGGGWFLGTPRYAAPEQAAGRPVDGRTDGYDLGCVLYECLTGRPPFPDGPGEAVLLAHLEATPPRVTTQRPDLPPAIDQVVTRAMAKAPEDRFPSCRALITAAHQALTQTTPTPRMGGSPTPGTPAPGAPTPSAPTPGAPAPGAPAPGAPAPGAPAPGAPHPPGPVPGPPVGERSPGPDEGAGVVHSPWERFAPAPPGALEGYLPLRRPGRRVRRALWVSLLLALASGFVNLGDTRMVRALAGDAAGTGDLYLWVGLVQAGWFLVTAGLWLAWFRRAYLNLPALGARRLRFRPWWAVGAWLLPVFSLFRPKQVLNDVWRASDPDLPAEQADTWRRRPVAELLGWWWLAFLASVLVRSITTEAVHGAADFMLLGLLPERFDRFQASAGMQVVADLLTVVCALLALRVVRRTTARQEERAARMAATGALARR